MRAPASFDLRHLWARGDGVGADAVSTRPRDAGVIGEPNQLPQKYVLRGYKREDVQAVSSQTLDDASTVLEEDGTVVYAFTKLLDEPGEKAVTSPFVWAHGSGSLGYHGGRAGALELNLETCEASKIKTEVVSAKLIKIHGGLFLVAFSVCMPAALVAARGRSWLGPVWIKLHMYLLLLCVLLALIGFVVVFAALEDAEESADPKAALIELILQCSGATEADAASAALRVELLQLKLGALGRRAIAEGVDEPLLEEAEDSEEPQAAIIELILAQRARS